MINATFNELLRILIWCFLWLVGWTLEGAFWLRLWRFSSVQRRLAAELGVDDATPCERHGPELDARLSRLHDERRRQGVSVAWAMTSGSTREPKRILYTAERVRERHVNFFDGYARIFSRLGIFRRSFYVMASLREERSLTAILLNEDRVPSRIVCLQAPYRIQADPAICELADEYGDAALRLWIIVLSQPAMLYATNPSTLVAWLDSLDSDWEASSRLCRHWVANPERFAGRVRELARRIESPAGRKKLRWLGRQAARPSLDALLPGLRVSSSWDGGYVRPFVDRLRAASHARFVPLYSMSTETIETVPCIRSGEIGFVPAAPGVLYEFILEDDPSRVLGPAELVTGREYVMLVSDRHGLRRYNTEDVFECVGQMRFGLPDLRFKRRTGVAYSFTGEKITGFQVEAALSRLRHSWRTDGPLPSFSVFPRPGDHPGYELVQVGGSPPAESEMERLIEEFERALSIENSEFSSKRSSGRLARTGYRSVSVEEFGRRVSGMERRGAWESQFKFLPLYTRKFS